MKKHSDLSLGFQLLRPGRGARWIQRYIGRSPDSSAIGHERPSTVHSQLLLRATTVIRALSCLQLAHQKHKNWLLVFAASLSLQARPLRHVAPPVYVPLHLHKTSARASATRAISHLPPSSTRCKGHTQETVTSQRPPASSARQKAQNTPKPSVLSVCRSHLVLPGGVLVLLDRGLGLLQPGPDGVESVGQVLGDAGGHLPLRPRERLHVRLALLEVGVDAVHGGSRLVSRPSGGGAGGGKDPQHRPYMYKRVRSYTFAALRSLGGRSKLDGSSSNGKIICASSSAVLRFNAVMLRKALYLVFFLVFSSSCCRRGCSLALSSFSSPSSVLSRSRSI